MKNKNKRTYSIDTIFYYATVLFFKYVTKKDNNLYVLITEEVNNKINETKFNEYTIDFRKDFLLTWTNAEKIENRLRTLNATVNKAAFQDFQKRYFACIEDIFVVFNVFEKVRAASGMSVTEVLKINNIGFPNNKKIEEKNYFEKVLFIEEKKNFKFYLSHNMKKEESQNEI